MSRSKALPYVWFAAFLVGGTSARADDWSVAVQRTDRGAGFEMASGADAAKDAWSIYGSLTAAPFGDLVKDGWRVRVGSGYGQYRYDRDVVLPGRAPVRPDHGHSAFAEALVGYQLTLGALTAKAFAGILGKQSLVAVGGAFNLFEDRADPDHGTRYGFKGALETWLDLGGLSFLQVDAGWNATTRGYGVRTRWGYRFGESLSVGPEAALYGSSDEPSGRIGAFARVTWTGGEASVSAGATGEGFEPDGAYGTIAVSWRF